MFISSGRSHRRHGNALGSWKWSRAALGGEEIWMGFTDHSAPQTPPTFMTYSITWAQICKQWRSNTRLHFSGSKYFDELSSQLYLVSLQLVWILSLISQSNNEVSTGREECYQLLVGRGCFTLLNNNSPGSLKRVIVKVHKEPQLFILDSRMAWLWHKVKKRRCVKNDAFFFKGGYKSVDRFTSQRRKESLFLPPGSLYYHKTIQSKSKTTQTFGNSLQRPLQLSASWDGRGHAFPWR